MDVDRLQIRRQAVGGGALCGKTKSRGTVAGLHNRCPRLGIQTTRPPPYSHPPLLPLSPASTSPPSSSPTSTTTMPEQTGSQPAAASKSKHSHATSQAQPAPRKVRFNVGKAISFPPASLPHASWPPKALSTRCSMSSVRARTALCARRCTDPAGARSPSRKSRPSITPCSVCAHCAS